MKVIASRLQDDVCDRTTGATEFRIEVARGNVDGLNGFEGRNQNLQQAGALVVVNSFDL